MLPGVIEWGIDILPLLLLYAILTSALNIQFGYGGIINFGVVAFFMVGAYTAALLTLPPPSSFESHILGLELPVPVGWLAGIVAALVLVVLVALPVVRLREDFLAIVTIGVAEILRTVANGADGFVNRSQGLIGIPQPLRGLTDDPDIYRWVEIGVMGAILLAVVGIGYAISTSPWGRVLRSVRDNEQTAVASGKRATLLRLQAFAIGAAVMGLAGAVYAGQLRTIGPEAFHDLNFTFLVWTLLIVGGSGRMLGAVVGALLVGVLWYGVNLVQSYLPQIESQYVLALRQFLIGAIIILFVTFRPQGLIPERATASRFLKRVRPRGDEGAVEPGDG